MAWREISSFSHQMMLTSLGDSGLALKPSTQSHFSVGSGVNYHSPRMFFFLTSCLQLNSIPKQHHKILFNSLFSVSLKQYSPNVYPWSCISQSVWPLENRSWFSSQTSPSLSFFLSLSFTPSLSASKWVSSKTLSEIILWANLSNSLSLRHPSQYILCVLHMYF